MQMCLNFVSLLAISGLANFVSLGHWWDWWGTLSSRPSQLSGFYSSRGKFCKNEFLFSRTEKVL